MIKTKKLVNGAKVPLSRLVKWCAYHYIYQVVVILIKGGDLSEQTRTGRHIALLGIFCPIFWFYFFSGAETSTLIFHGTHSGIVFLIGVVIMVVSLKKKRRIDE
ncbi:hypothetical protein [Oceanospirillum maris]|jgi:hypothetical protein|uniref:hypothetical protein n=1 Tax=Oceanospirillum maris TaxID=64977 RepID=UPI00068857FD|nr:hypothetical protein [Oceanospirillum maris]